MSQKHGSKSIENERSADAFRAAMLDKIGAAPAEIIGDGAIRRFAVGRNGRDDAGWCVFHDDAYPSGAFGNWKTGESYKWRAREVAEMSPADKARLAELKAERERKSAAAYANAAASALKRWNNAKSAQDCHPYLTSKKVRAFGIREANGCIVVPVYIGDEISSIQTIDANGDKLFAKGSRVEGGFFVIGEITDTAIIGEGYATCASIFEATGLPVVVAFNAGNLEPVAKKIRAKHPTARICIVADDDHRAEAERGFNPGRREAEKAAKAIGGMALAPPFDRKAGDAGTDWNDFAAAKGIQAVAAEFRRTLDEAEIVRLASLKPIEYDRERAKVAEALGVRTATLDALIKAKREDSATEKAASLVTEFDPWPEPVNAAELLRDVRRAIRRFIVCEEATATAAALWIAFSHCIDDVQIAPIALITAPEKRCGKTQLLDLISRLSRRPLLASNVSPAATFRVIEASSPTLIIDEADAFFRDNEELRGIINSGHTRTTAFVIRCVGDDFEPKRFSTWGAKAIAGIGRLADTIMDRSIVLELRRKLPHEKVDRLRHAESGLFEVLARKLARFGADHGREVGRARPNLPAALNDRAQDNWEPLLAIADLAGGIWPSEARRAALGLSGNKSDDKSTAEELLSDIRTIFEVEGVDRIGLSELLKRLTEDESAPWQTWNRGKPMTARQLGRRLGEFGIDAATVHIDRFDKPKGYRRDQFSDAWSRYLDSGDTPSLDTPLPPVTSVTTSKSGPFVVTERVTEENSVGHQPGRPPQNLIFPRGDRAPDPTPTQADAIPWSVEL